LLLKIVLYGYSRGMISSRSLEYACQKLTTFMALACNKTPDYSTIAAFVSSIDEEVEDLFTMVLMTCHEEGLLGGTHFSIDGLKLSSNASSSDSLYRSEKTSAKGMANLKAAGIETIVSLRSFHSDRDEIENLGLAYEHIYMKAWHPEEEDAVRFPQIDTNPKRTPVLVHCQHGADRTGIMCALYRVAVQDWDKKVAYREMTEGGFGFHEIWENLPSWFGNLDIEAIRKKAGIKSSTEEKTSPGKK
jgi:protein tyrosine phosphatase (PTP) superfamily phosphohydrolase (DUF442 family)